MHYARLIGFLGPFVILHRILRAFPRASATTSVDGMSSSSTNNRMDDRITLFRQTMDGVYGAFTNDRDYQPAPFHGKSRYLWTDAYGVCNYLTLYRETGETLFLIQAQKLVAAVHESLGKTRDGRKRLGTATEAHPLDGGLRIGKSEDEDPGMSGDGQYFHYLTKWMFALNRMTEVTGDPQYNEWAIELARAVHFKFCTPDRKRMIWKMSIDLQRPLTYSEGGLDPFDGLTMYLLLRDTAKIFTNFDGMSSGETEKWEASHLKPETDHITWLVAFRMATYTAHDTLDAGEALWLAHFYPDLEYSRQLKEKAGKAVELLWKRGEFSGFPAHRLAFRELGTTMGVQMHPDLWRTWKGRVEGLHAFWREHLTLRDNDITPVMFCTSLLPGLFRRAAV